MEGATASITEQINELGMVLNFVGWKMTSLWIFQEVYTFEVKPYFITTHTEKREKSEKFSGLFQHSMVS